jgi:hypothetical protein
MSSESEFAYSLKYNTCFIVRNITGTPASKLHLAGENPNIPPPYQSGVFYVSQKKTINIFHYPINAGCERDLLQIPGVQESDIRASLLKGELRHKFLCGDIELVCSNIDLLQFSDKQRDFLQSFGFTEGVTVGYDELDGYVQNLINQGGGGGITPQEHEVLRQLIHFIDSGGPGHGFSPQTFKETLPASSPFPTSVIWWLEVAKIHKLVEKIIIYNVNQFPATIQWNMYGTDGVTIVQSLIDTFTYSGAFETSRTRTIL